MKIFIAQQLNKVYNFKNVKFETSYTFHLIKEIKLFSIFIFLNYWLCIFHKETDQLSIDYYWLVSTIIRLLSPTATLKFVTKVLTMFLDLQLNQPLFLYNYNQN